MRAIPTPFSSSMARSRYGACLSDVEIGIVERPEQSPLWPFLKALLEPAAKRGGVDKLLGEHDLVWAVIDGEPLAAATTRLLEDETAEVVLVGGREYRRWLGPLSDMIGRAAFDAGALRLRACGRRGWARVLQREGWTVMGEKNGFTGYEKALR